MAKKYGFGSAARTHLYVQIAFIGLFIYIILSFLSLLLPLLIPLIISFALAFFCNPLVSYLEKKKIPRTLGILIILLLVIALFTVFIIFIVPLLAKELKVFIGKIPGYSDQIKNWAIPWIESTFKTRLPNLRETANTITDRLSQDLSDIASQAYVPLRRIANFAAVGTFFIFSFVTTLFVIPFFTFFILRDFEKLKRIPGRLIPPRHWDNFNTMSHGLNDTLSSWLRGQIVVMMILGFLYSAGYSFVGITLSLFIGLITGFLAFVPYVGAFIGFLLAMSMALLDGGWTKILGVIFVFSLVQTLDAFFITPNVLGKSVGLNPAIVVIALIGFGIIWGFWGALVAVPMAAIINVIVRHFYINYKNSVYFNRID